MDEDQTDEFRILRPGTKRYFIDDLMDIDEAGILEMFGQLRTRSNITTDLVKGLDADVMIFLQRALGVKRIVVRT